MKDPREKLLLIACATILVLGIMVTTSILVSAEHHHRIAMKESDTAIELARMCGEREWVAWWEHSPIKGRRIKCLEKRTPTNKG